MLPELTENARACWVSQGEAVGTVVQKMYFAALEEDPCPLWPSTPTSFLLPFAICDMWITPVINVTLTLGPCCLFGCHNVTLGAVDLWQSDLKCSGTPSVK